MFRTLALGSLAALTFTTAGTAATVKSVDVAVELSAIENPRAAEYWTSIADDLENAIVAKIEDQIADDGIDLKIDLEEVWLSNGFEEKLGLADTRLVGDVSMTHASDNSRFGSYQLTVDVNTALPLIPADVDVTVLPADSRVYYDAMIAAFAQGVVDRLK
ncbi:MAG: hypothetical protein U1E06_07230 [Tabrizicola sp.]|uniref:hypothetical protein n=1 Tax=Tabrizicola sp. TaxID=2005166 RepID=UPI0027330F4B|nr:hypothetical protein [Tabrizicola sp.]MDP3264681.1 hypothetical protein [Tabrizicola sp.]MDP3649876.1 hypothetical protein [Paracoccaceae bacterium]MDZ4066633.1 hypothetical protein [Tabrizicola sp.]